MSKKQLTTEIHSYVTAINERQFESPEIPNINIQMRKLLTIMLKVLEYCKKSTFRKLHLKKKLKLNYHKKLEHHFLKFDSRIKELDCAGRKTEETHKVHNFFLKICEKCPLIMQ